MSDLITQKILKKINKVPALPTSLSNIIETINNPNASADDVNKAISTDQALVMKVLRLVNSSYYGLSKRVTSITQAIVILGFNTIKSLALSASVMDLFSAKENEKFDRSEFWKHSFSVALCAKLIARHIKISNKFLETYFMSGLLHDIGKVVLDQYFTTEFDTILKLVEINKISMYEAEKEIMQFNHCDIAKYLTKKWNLPNELVDSITYHHTPEKLKDEECKKIASVVHLSNYLVKAKHIGFSGEYNLSGFKESEVIKIDTITPELIKKLIEFEIDREIEKASSLFALL